MAVVNPFQQINASLPPLVPAPQMQRDPSLDNAQLPLEDDQQQIAPSSRPQVFSSAPKPTPQDRQETMLGGRLEQDYQKDLHPWGTPENHPGVWGKIAHGVSVATGGPNRRLMEESGIEGRLNKLAEMQSQNAYRGAETAKDTAETPEIAPDAESKRGLETAQAGEADARTDALRNPQDTNPDMATYRSLVKLGMSPSEALQEIEKDKALALKPTGREHVNLQDSGGKPYGATFDPSAGKYYDTGGKEIANPVPYEKPMSVNAGDASIDRLAGRLGKPYQTGFDASGKQLDNIDKTLRSIDSGYKGQALALPETLTSLVSGQGTGVRVTMPELQMIGQHNGVKGDIESFFNRISGQGSMTDEDKNQLKGILAEARQHIQIKQQIHQNALDSINGAESREDIQKADKLARQQLTEYEQHGFYTGQKVPQGTVVGFNPKTGGVLIDDAR